MAESYFKNLFNLYEANLKKKKSINKLYIFYKTSKSYLYFKILIVLCNFTATENHKQDFSFFFYCSVLNILLVNLKMHSIL